MPCDLRADEADDWTDPAGNIKADKEKSTEKIDGAVAAIMGLDRAIRCGNDKGVHGEGICQGGRCFSYKWILKAGGGDGVFERDIQGKGCACGQDGGFLRQAVKGPAEREAAGKDLAERKTAGRAPEMGLGRMAPPGMAVPVEIAAPVGMAAPEEMAVPARPGELETMLVTGVR